MAMTGMSLHRIGWEHLSDLTSLVCLVAFVITWKVLRIVSAGDVIGCGIDFDIHKAFYTKNGTFLGKSPFISIRPLHLHIRIYIGYAFQDIGKEGDEPLFPSVGMRNKGERVRAYLGQDAYRYSLEDYPCQTHTH